MKDAIIISRRFLVILGLLLGLCCAVFMTVFWYMAASDPNSEILIAINRHGEQLTELIIIPIAAVIILSSLVMVIVENIKYFKEG